MQTFSRLVEPKAFRYDAFLCFRGVDTRYGFTGNLCKALHDRGFRPFMDDREIEEGTHITVELPKAIEESRIFIIVLSVNFASSSFCLNEIVKILHEFRKGKGRWVWPVFYYVDRSNLADTYKQALADQKEWFNVETIEEWRTALSTVAEFSGCPLIRDGSIPEYRYIEHILKEVSRHVTCAIGLPRRVSEVNSRLYSGSDVGVRMVGICGKVETGKTMIARGVYNFNVGRGFDHYCFFDNEGENLSKHGLIHLQQMLLSEIIGHNYTKFGNVDEGMSILNQKKIFIIFEDINDSKQLKNIIELTNWLGSGSKVIITAQDKCLFDSHGIKSIYEVEKFNNTEAFQLLSLKAFNSAYVSANYVNILNRVETYALGHPRTLEVIGSNLSGKSIEECESTLVKYESITNRDIQKILEESYNALEECQQMMLTQIALCLKGLELVEVEDKLRNTNKVCPKMDIRVLLDKSLMKINEHGQLTLHSSTQDMIRDKVPCYEDYGKKEIQSVSNDGSMIWDPMELEYQLPYQHCCSSSFRDDL